MYNLKTYDLLGKVKTVMTKTFEPRNLFNELDIPSGKTDHIFIEDEEFIFNTNGKLMETCKCDAQGKMITLHLFSYNHKGDLIQDFFYSPDGLIFRTVHLYNKNGRSIAQINYLSESIFMDVSIYIVDAKGEHYSTESYNKDGVLTETVDYKLNDYGTTVGLTNSRSDGSIKYKDRSKVNANQVEIQRYIETVDSFYKGVVRYDDNHNEMERVYYKSKYSVKERYEFKYEFDNYRNWIKKYVYKNGQLYRVYFRELEYY